MNNICFAPIRFIPAVVGCSKNISNYFLFIHSAFSSTFLRYDNVFTTQVANKIRQSSRAHHFETRAKTLTLPLFRGGRVNVNVRWFLL